jgi:murein DD-endopeptidase MepM/ murein hydrolase activator NlpD
VVVLAAALGLAQQSLGIGIDVRARSLQPGEAVLLTITTADGKGAVHVRVFDRDWIAFPAGPAAWRVLVGIDLDQAPGDYDVTVRVDTSSGVRRGSQRLTVSPRTFPTRKLTVDEAFVNPPAEVQPRIAREAAELEKLWQSSTGPARWTAPFEKPVPHEANSAFGTRSIFNDQPRSPHSGADFSSPAGTPVLAPAAGRVVLARDLYFSGNTVIIDHGAGLLSLFAHLSAIDVTAGTEIKAGTPLGRVGATGRVTGAHLHWATRLGGARVDPLSVIYVLR